MEKIFLIFISLAISALSIPTTVKAAPYPVPAPTGLQATVWSKDREAEIAEDITGIAPYLPSSLFPASVTLEWRNSSSGISYKVTRISPDGTKKYFTLDGRVYDPNCVMKGGFLTDSDVKSGETYTYKVKAFDGSFNYSSEAEISVTINIGDTIGCRGWKYLALEAKSINSTLALAWKNDDHKQYEVFVDGNSRGKTDKSEIKIWPVFGEHHSIIVAKVDGRGDERIAKADECAVDTAKLETATQKSYSGVLGSYWRFIDRLVDDIVKKG